MWELLSHLNAALTVPSDVPLNYAFGFLAALPMIGSAIGSIFGKGAGGKSDQRMQEGALINQANRNAVDLYGTAQNAQMQAGGLDLSRKSFTEDARGGRAKQAIIGDLLSRLQPGNVSVAGIPNAEITGGLNANVLGPLGRQSAAELAKQALLAQMTPDQFQGGQILPQPQLQGLPKAGGLEKFLDMAGLIGSAVGGIGSSLGAMKGQPMQTGGSPINYDPSVYKVNF